MRRMTLTVLAPDRSMEPLECDSIHIDIHPGEKSKGGLYGIRPGHIKTIFMLEEGPVQAYLEGQKIFEAHCSKGFASVDNNTVHLLVEDYQVK